MPYDNFFSFLFDSIDFFRQKSKDRVVRLISHLDADGICSAAILSNALNNENIPYKLSIVKQLGEEVLSMLQSEEYQFIIFSDLGAGQLELIKKFLPDKDILILDHHSIEEDLVLPKNIFMVNPHQHGIDGSSEISGSGVCYFFSKTLNDKNVEMSHIAIVGAIGDIQEDNGFKGINNIILEDAKGNGKLRIEKAINWYGIGTKSLYKLLLYDTSVELPGVTGDETKVIMFLEEAGIDAKKNGEWTKFDDLDEIEKERLITAIVIKRNGLENPHKIFTNRYVFIDEKPGTHFRDAKEFSTLLNACGRMDKATYGIGACLGDTESKRLAEETLLEYRKEIVSAMRWYEDCNDIPDIIEKTNKYIIIKARDHIRPTIIGTLASIISNSKDLTKGTIILSLAYDDKILKVSIRNVGEDNEIDLKELIDKITKSSFGEAGGHKNAAGAIVPIEHEQEFIDAARKILDAL